MQYLQFSIYDEVMKNFNLPFAAISDAEAMRSFRIACNEPTSLLRKSPQDYSLYKVAVYDDQKGTFENLNMPDLIARASEFVIYEKNEA